MCGDMCTHHCRAVSHTAQMERLVQAFFNMALTPDISFVSVITCSGFAASRSCQNPYSPTLCIIPFCSCCQSLFHTRHEHLILHPQPDLNQRAKKKGLPGRVADQIEAQNKFNKECILTENSVPAATLNLEQETSCLHQLGKRQPTWCLDCALCRTFRMLSFLEVLISEQTWFMASLTLHYSITTVGDNDKAASELHCSRQGESHTHEWVLRKGWPTCVMVREHPRSRMGLCMLKVRTNTASGILFSYSRPCSNASY